ncbi:DNA-binding Lrp family transcriptional regulator [Kineococcus radiotolerans]|uniref:Transcriptional regulator, AsnC family n=2 Tax=Kineococcus radiotolerans TaxID=131568 RepID=A6WFG0_KINRD|nr:Lrp/AsnC family transcriptional regulator [Kineococcus radiotolerans]ABS05549.1 putative transcriptional regulator, AsnC family [Kineococcus radiotolerans SRS30216 = ATCC BAA-149]MBB2902432.1 DNA-binding Lrp family transcriptional regulator [Kineococcus radiotolerans]
MEGPSTRPVSGPVPPKKLQRVVDPVDRAILRVLADDARITNAALAQQVGIAASTCLLRVRALRESGVIRGFHADIDPAALGLDLQAMIAVKLAAHARGSMGPFVARMRRQPEVVDVYFVAGADDYLLHVAVESTAALRDFVAEHLSQDPDVGLTETSLIFEHTRGVGRD